MAWTRERLENTVRERLGEAKLIVVANREPYIHVYEGDEIRCMRPASGLATALDPVMRACGGVWVAHGSGNADRAMVDDQDRVAVPPEDPAYTLRRVWLSKKEEQGYYYGFSNEALWPLCHVAYTRPRFSSSDWSSTRMSMVSSPRPFLLRWTMGRPWCSYRIITSRFCRECSRMPATIWLWRNWHIPWPNREVFRICPWQEEILDGLLGNDLLAFHTQYHCNNFLDTIDRAVEAKVDWEHFCVTRGGLKTCVRPYPISIDPELVQSCLPLDKAVQERNLRQRLGLRDEQILVGVDRVDYTKGIPERFTAVDRLLQLHPELKGTFCFVQIGAPSRVHIPAYRRLNEELAELADKINWRHGQGTWRPIAFVNEHYGPEQVFGLYRIAAGCVVSSLHDGMNLVARNSLLRGTMGKECWCFRSSPARPAS